MAQLQLSKGIGEANEIRPINFSVFLGKSDNS